jgi:CheY-like chemotaxis protein
MRILVADDEPVSRLTLVAQLRRLGHETLEAKDGVDALEALRREPVECVITDWMMPGLAGPELCRRIRASDTRAWAYVLLLTSREGRESFIEGRDAGADEFMSKPFDAHVLRARLHVAQRLLDVERALRARVERLQQALNEVERLRGILPICMYCKKVQDGPDAWQAIEQYVSDHSDASFSHGVCPVCQAGVMASELAAMRARSAARSPVGD